MLKNKTGYPITEASAQTLSNISGFPLKDIKANIGWIAVYDESNVRRWGILPRGFAIDHGYKIDEVSYQ